MVLFSIITGTGIFTVLFLRRIKKKCFKCKYQLEIIRKLSCCKRFHVELMELFQGTHESQLLFS